MTACQRCGTERTVSGYCGAQGQHAVCRLRAELREVKAERDALHRLPVIATCGDCRWCHLNTESCSHERAHIEDEIDGSDRTPPEWCPLRGAR